MAERGKSPEPEGWRLGIELREPQEFEEEPAEPQERRNLSAERLERPLFVLTVERALVAVIALWAVVSRLAMLAARPLSESEAQRTIAALGVARGGLAALGAHGDAASSMVTQLLGASVMGLLGADGFAARLVYAVAGILMVWAALAMRRWLGRAGALAFGAMLALSPTVTYYGRYATGIIPALALVIFALVLLDAISHRPDLAGALALGIVAAFALDCDPASVVVGGVMLAALAIVGIWEGAGVGNAWQRFWVWWHRRRGLALAGVGVMVAFGLLIETNFAHRTLREVLRQIALANFSSGPVAGYSSGLQLYAPIFVLDEFLVVVCAAVGLIALLCLRLRTRFSLFCTAWLGLSVVAYGLLPHRAPALAPALIVPAALVGALGINYLHRTGAWIFLRYPLGVLAALTLLVQLASNFVYVAPDPSEAAWARRALLYWSEPQTTLSTVWVTAALAKNAPHGDTTVFFEEGCPAALRWYLRRLTAVERPEDAYVVVDGRGPGHGLPGRRVGNLELEESWHPTLTGLTAAKALGYIFTARPWTPLTTHQAVLLVKSSDESESSPSAPTRIYPPPVLIAPAAAKVAEAPAHTKAARHAPSAHAAPKQPTSTPSLTPRPRPSPTPRLKPSPAQTSTPKPRSTPTAEPSDTPKI